MNGRRIWTEAEDKICRYLHPDLQAIRARLSDRSYQAIRQRCNKLGLSPKRHVWTAAEVSRLRKLYPRATQAELLSAFPFTDMQGLMSKASSLGYCREKKPYVPTGHQVLDQIRERCRDLGLIMKELDDIARSKRFFQKQGWRGSTFNHRVLSRSVKTLGGSLRVEWDDIE